MWYQNIGSMFHSFVTEHAYDGQTDGPNYDHQDCASIAASRGKNQPHHTSLSPPPDHQDPHQTYHVESENRAMFCHNTLALQKTDIQTMHYM